MNQKRRALLAALVATSLSQPAHAGCLDWLFGKPAAPVFPYTAAYPPATTVTPIGPPTLVPGSPLVANYPPTANSSNPATAGTYSPYAANYASIPPSYALQAPAYGTPIENPSVLTGRPVMPVPGSGVVAASGFDYSSGTAGAIALPPAALVPPPSNTGIGGFFSRLFGTNYQTAYYNVPTTTYRPVAQIDPATGATVIVQQPCTSITQQVQRSPYASLQPTAPAAVPYFGEPVCGGEPPRYAPLSTFSTPMIPSSGYAPSSIGGYPSAVSQATAMAPLNGSNGAYSQGVNGFGAPIVASPIPSTVPYSGFTPGSPDINSQPATLPLTGYPNAASSDASPIEPPQLGAARPDWSTPSNAVPVQPVLPPASPSVPLLPPASSLWPSTGGSLQAPPLPANSDWSGRSVNREFGNASSNIVAGDGDLHERYRTIAPIPASDEYRAPNWAELYSEPNATSVDSGRESWTQPSPSFDEPRTAQVDSDLDSNMSQSESGSLRYASAPAAPTRLEAFPPLPSKRATPRDDSGWFVIEPK